MKNKKYITTTELSNATGYSVSRIRQIAREIPGSLNPSKSGWIFENPAMAITYMLEKDERKKLKPKNERKWKSG